MEEKDYESFTAMFLLTVGFLAGILVGVGVGIMIVGV